MQIEPLDPQVVRALVAASLSEDRADLDLTTQSLATWLGTGRAEMVARAGGVICGIAFAQEAFAATGATFEPNVSDGSEVSTGSVVGTASGALGSLLRAERVALNWIQRLSGTATLTARAVSAAQAGGAARILDTRKTTPGLRAAERYAVRCGGGLNHRDSLAAGVLIKDNHIAAVKAAGGSLADTVRTALANVGPATAVEVEVTNLAEAEEALEAGARSLLLDNFALEALPPAVELAKRYGATTEASGGIVVEQIKAISAAGVDYISMGALTHSAPALDIALDVRVSPSPPALRGEMSRSDRGGSAPRQPPLTPAGDAPVQPNQESP